jgi:hypothetical protein
MGGREALEEREDLGFDIVRGGDGRGEGRWGERGRGN